MGLDGESLKFYVICSETFLFVDKPLSRFESFDIPPSTNKTKTSGAMLFHFCVGDLPPAGVHQEWFVVAIVRAFTRICHQKLLSAIILLIVNGKI